MSAWFARFRQRVVKLIVPNDMRPADLTAIHQQEDMRGVDLSDMYPTVLRNDVGEPSGDVAYKKGFPKRINK